MYYSSKKFLGQAFDQEYTNGRRYISSTYFRSTTNNL